MMENPEPPRIMGAEVCALSEVYYLFVPVYAEILAGKVSIIGVAQGHRYRQHIVMGKIALYFERYVS